MQGVSRPPGTRQPPALGAATNRPVSIEAVHPVQPPPDTPAQHLRTPASEHAHPAGDAGVSPLWWSASRRIGCAAGLVALLWIVIAWALT
jgi:hypothetical protein